MMIIDATVCRCSSCGSWKLEQYLCMTCEKLVQNLKAYA
jgi:hypothetical protein